MVITANRGGEVFYYLVLDHAEAAMFDDNIKEAEVIQALQNEPEPDWSHAERWVYRYDDIVVITNDDMQYVITVFREG